MVGLREIFADPEGAFCVLQGKGYAGYSLVLIPASARHKPGVHQLAFELADPGDLAGVSERLAAKGLRVEYAIEHPTKQAVYFRDPDNILVQAYHETPDFLDSLEGMDPALAVLLL